MKLNKTYGVHHVNVSSNDTNQINRHNNLIGKSRHVLCVDGVNFGEIKKKTKKLFSSRANSRSLDSKSFRIEIKDFF